MITTDTREAIMKSLANSHPGEVLLKQFLTPRGISRHALAHAADISPVRINQIVLGKRDITVDTDVRLSAALGTSQCFWLELQGKFDLEQGRLGQLLMDEELLG